MEVNKTIKNLRDTTNGKKTYIVGGIALVFEIMNDVFPNLMSEEREMLAQKILFYLLYYGVLDKIWRNRKEITIFVKDIFNKLIKKQKK